MQIQTSIQKQTNFLGHPCIETATQLQCKDGSSTACITTVIAGEPRYEQPLVLLHDNEASPCGCCSVTTDFLEKR